MPEFKRLFFAVDIAAPPALVCERMLDPGHYRDWTTAFCEGSRYEGRWREGERIRFLAPTGDGMLSEIAAYRPGEYTSVRHVGVLSNGEEDTSGDAAEAWAGALENYRFVPTPEGTRVEIEQDVTPAYEAYLAAAWPQALQRLKALCERGAPG
ncbi:MAG: SRPBCC domain-containing protein [Rubrivivax sp.]